MSAKETKISGRGLAQHLGRVAAAHQEAHTAAAEAVRALHVALEPSEPGDGQLEADAPPQDGPPAATGTGGSVRQDQIGGDAG